MDWYASSYKTSVRWLMNISVGGEMAEVILYAIFPSFKTVKNTMPKSANMVRHPPPIQPINHLLIS
jgi:hypothetical protein